MTGNGLPRLIEDEISAFEKMREERDQAVGRAEVAERELATANAELNEGDHRGGWRSRLPRRRERLRVAAPWLGNACTPIAPLLPEGGSVVKRSRLVRRTPLKAKTALTSRTELRRSPLAAGSTVLRRTPLSPVSTKQAAKNRVRVVTEKDLGREGCYGICARCLTVTYVNGHERRNRSQGGDSARPDCLLCIPCNGWAAENIIPACWTGWRISPKYSHAPELENGQAYDLAGNLVIFAHSTNAEEVA